MFIAKQFMLYGNYNDDDANLLFHLANGHDLTGYLGECHEEDHKMASRYPDGNGYRPKESDKEDKETDKETDKESDTESEFDMAMTVAGLIRKYAAEISCVGVDDKPDSFSRHIMDYLPIRELTEHMLRPAPKDLPKCAFTGCRCEEMEKGEFKKWLTKLYHTMACKPSWGPGTDRQSLFKTVDQMSEEARSLGIKVTVTFREDKGIPVSSPVFSMPEPVSRVCTVPC